MVPFNLVTPTPADTKAIISRQRKRIEDLASIGTLSEGLRAQYELQLEAYECGKAGNCELVPFPNYVILNGMSLSFIKVFVVLKRSAKWMSKRRNTSLW